MHIVILHGYILQGTGSNVYVANVAKTWKAQGHKVTILCQDRTAAALSFVDEFIIGKCPKSLSAPGNGKIRVIIPDIDNLLPVYVMDEYKGYKVKKIQTMSKAEINNHIDKVKKVLIDICKQQKIDKVFTNHALLNPIIAYKALKGTNIPYDIKIHGSAIEFTLIPSPELMKYSVPAIKNAKSIYAGTQHIKNRILEVFSKYYNSSELITKIKIVPPGMDPSLFEISDNFKLTNSTFINKVKSSIDKDSSGRDFNKIPNIEFPDNIAPEKLHEELEKTGKTYNQRTVDSDLLSKWNLNNENKPVILYFGKFLQTKGVGELLAMVPSILAKNPKLKFIFSGFGTYREHMEQLLNAYSDNNLKKAVSIGKAGNFITEIDICKYFIKMPQDIKERIIITGFLNHDLLSQILPLASICIVPSKLSEAFGMVAVEAMACGVVPICNNHSGLKDILDTLKQECPELTDITVKSKESFFEKLPETIEKTVNYLYPEGFEKHKKMNSVRKEMRTISVNNFSWNKIAEKLLEE